MKALLSVAISLVFTVSLYASSTGWSKGSISSNVDPSIKARIVITDQSQKAVVRLLASSECATIQSKVAEERATVVVNGKEIVMLSQCVALFTVMETPESKEAQEYIVNEFKTKEFVTYKQNGLAMRFRTQDFAKEFNSFRQQ